MLFIVLPLACCWHLIVILVVGTKIENENVIEMEIEIKSNSNIMGIMERKKEEENVSGKQSERC